MAGGFRGWMWEVTGRARKGAVPSTFPCIGSKERTEVKLRAPSTHARNDWTCRNRGGLSAPDCTAAVLRSRRRSIGGDCRPPSDPSSSRASAVTEGNEYSRGATASREISLGLPEADGTAVSGAVSPLRAAIPRPFGRDDPDSTRRASPPDASPVERSAGSERDRVLLGYGSEVETPHRSCRERMRVLRPCRCLHSVSSEDETSVDTTRFRRMVPLPSDTLSSQASAVTEGNEYSRGATASRELSWGLPDATENAPSEEVSPLRAVPQQSSSRDDAGAEENAVPNRSLVVSSKFEPPSVLQKASVRAASMEMSPLRLSEVEPSVDTTCFRRTVSPTSDAASSRASDSEPRDLLGPARSGRDCCSRGGGECLFPLDLASCRASDSESRHLSGHANNDRRR